MSFWFIEVKVSIMESTTLIIKHLPSEFTTEEKEELLQHFGATKVRCMSNTGRMKHTAFANFPNRENAEIALKRLHQLEILGCRLVVEFAKVQHQNDFPHESDFKRFSDKQKDVETNGISEKENMRLRMEEFSRRIHAVAPHLRLDYLPSPLLKYSYPSPSPSIISNIANALASVPKFYTQVLHLMNKMNLPPPFGPVTQAPPLQPDIHIQENLEQDIVEEEEMDMTSSEESELESDDELKKQQPTTVKRQLKKQKRKVKKPKLKDLLGTTVTSFPKTTTGPVLTHTDVFDVPSENQTLKKIQINLKPSNEAENIDENDDVAKDKEPIHVEEGGFGTIAPHKTDEDAETNQDEDMEDIWRESKFITLQELKRKKCSESEMKHLPVFKNYKSGQPTYRLYIKNLAKQVSEEDLRYVYGRYIDRTSTTERNMFDIRLMKEGRMKGQAFITLATEEQAIQALKDTNGYVLSGKPLVVQFARSAKPKDQKTSVESE
ncbi:RNA-binding region-containing protein 3-like isoform X1 [Centruroides vittatus]|uniref:RNA-binding region-containing protein 3-like isoform X1 n=2 Tax=Centruroides vittatus TaxID=120091 RepID=UPI0035104569